LPGTYANAAGPVAALFAIMTKVGAYSIIRVFMLAFTGNRRGGNWFCRPMVDAGAVITLFLGMIGVVASRSLGQQASFAALASMGTTLDRRRGVHPGSESAALYYLFIPRWRSLRCSCSWTPSSIRRSGLRRSHLTSPRGLPRFGLDRWMFFVWRSRCWACRPCLGLLASC
jgi:multicomponent K+:H+ antiporter subunit D